MNHVLIIPSWYRSKFNLLSGSFFYEQAKCLSNQDLLIGVLAVNLISPRLILEKKSWPSQEISSDNMNSFNEYTIDLPSIRPLNSIMQVYFGMKLFSRYIVNHGLPDLLHVHSFFAAKIAIEIKNKYDIPFVITEHQSKVGLRQLGVTQYLDAKRAYMSASQVISVSPYLSDVINCDFKVPAITIPNMYDFNLSKIGLNPVNRFKFLSVGSLDQNKNHYDFIRLAHELSNKYPCEFHLVGDGPLMERLKSKVLSLNLGDSFIFHGSCDREKTLRIFSECDCYVHTSFYETFGIVYLEAFASGLPVISYDTKGASDLINASNGFIVQSFDALLQKALYILENYNLYCKSKIRLLAEQQYSPDIVAKKIKHVYKSVV